MYARRVLAVEMAKGSERRRRGSPRGAVDSDEAKQYARRREAGGVPDAGLPGILRVMDGKPVVIRLLDAPLHEFLPPHEDAAAGRGGRCGRPTPDSPELRGEGRAAERRAVAAGVRTRCWGTAARRLGLTYPEVYQMQVRAIVRAACDLQKEGLDPRPEVMVPLVMDAAELKALKQHLADIIDEYQRVRRQAQGIALRDDDRAAARGSGRGPDRAGGGVLLVRLERPDADDVRIQPGRRGGEVPALLPRDGSCRSTRSPRSTSRASGA